MIQRPPRSTRTDTLFPYTTLFRSFLHILHRTLAFLDGGLDLALGLGAQNLAQLHHHHVVGRRGGGGFQRHPRSEEHTSELQSLTRNSYAVFCLKTKKIETDDGRIEHINTEAT